MNIIRKIFCLGIISVSLAIMASCSDDDNNNTISYQNHKFDNAYTKSEAQDYMANVNNKLFSSSNIDTLDIFPLIAACRYFNDTYLFYKTETGEKPFCNIVNNISKMVGGDMSGLSGILDKFKTIGGSYATDIKTKTWIKKENANNLIVLSFKDEYNEDMKVSFSWEEKDETGWTNVFKIKDANGNITRDTIPAMIELCISGGKSKIYFKSRIYCSVLDGCSSLRFRTNTDYGLGYDDIANIESVPYSITTYSTISDNAILSQISLSKEGTCLVSIDVRKSGENIVNGLVDNTRYPTSMDKSVMNIEILNNVKILQTENTALLQKKFKEIKTAGYKTGSEKFVKSYCNAVNECREITTSNPNNNYFIYKISSLPCYDATNSVWKIMPYFTLNDNSSYSAIEFDTTGIIASGLSKIQELIDRLSGFVESASVKK